MIEFLSMLCLPNARHLLACALTVSGVLSASLAQRALASGELLPYSNRTRPYSGAGTTVRGDIRTVGMAGATFGLGDTFIAATDNPAGLAMTMNQGDLNITSNWAQDNRVQGFDTSIHTSNAGLALSPYPWAAALGYVVPYREANDYRLPGLGGDPVALNLSIREVRASLARVLLDDKLSVGLGLILAQSEAEYKMLREPRTEAAYHAYSLGMNVGALYQLPSRFLVGAAFQPSMRFSGDSSQTLPGMNGFYQDIEVPSRFGVGLGWIPNRFFRTDFSILFLGSTPGAAPLRSDAVPLGESVTIHPRLGAAYQIADYPEFRATFFSGIYYENVRVADASDRIHLTLGVETKPWVFSLGWGLDVSAGYDNYLVTAGIDIFRVMQKLDLIPKPAPLPKGGALPQFSHSSDVGLPRPLVANWQPDEGPSLDPVQIGLDLPRRFQKKAKEVGTELKNLGQGAVENVKEFFEPPERKKTSVEPKAKKRRNMQRKAPQTSPASPHGTPVAE